MLFNSYIFIFLFLPTVLAGFFLVARTSHRLAALWLASGSLFFYGWWNPQFVLLLMGSTAFNYAMGCAIGRVRERQSGGEAGRMLLTAAVAADLTLLCLFKYTNFFIGTVNSVSNAEWGLFEIVLPLGISFYTFTQIAFLVDVHRGIAREYNFIHYLLFVTYFPHLIAGPVLHHKQMMPQFEDAATYRLTLRNINIGLTIFAIGLFKKVMLADQFARYSNPFFAAVAGGAEPQFLEAWAGTATYALQLYFDFSAYSDMAIGLSLMFNVRLPFNFNSPYKATNIIEFWRRWHMTLSAFLRDYLYIPLGGNRNGVGRRHVNLLITMLLGGLWHGANWTFLLWGGLHGLFLVINHGWRNVCGRLDLPAIPCSRLLGGTLTFLAVVVAWVPFRSENIDVMWRVWNGMAGVHGIALPSTLQEWLPQLASYGYHFHVFGGPLNMPQNDIGYWLLIGLCVVFLMPNTQQWTGIERTELIRRRLFQVLRWRPNLGFALIGGTVFSLSVVNLSQVSPFLYFQF